MVRARAGLWLFVAGVVGLVVAVALVRSRSTTPAAPKASETPALSFIDAGAETDDDRAYSFRVPSGEPAALTCEAAHTVVAQARANLAYEPDLVAPHALATATTDWLDPHGLWSAAPDAPIGDVIEQHSAVLLKELEATTNDDCSAAREVGGALVKWVAELARHFDQSRATPTTKANLVTAASDSMFDTADDGMAARDLATMLGERVGSVERSVGVEATPFADAARARFFPSLDADGWGRVVLAAAVRAYVQIVDPHGAWAPFDEEASVYEVDLEARPPDRLWDRAARTAIGVRIETDPEPPFREGDVVLSLAGVATAGLPLEQLDQLSFAATGEGKTNAVVLRQGEQTLRTLSVGTEEASGQSSSPRDELLVERVPYGSSDAVVVSIHDVRDDLGDELTRALLVEREHNTRPIAGLVLDLRGNGGGSTEGAIEAVGLFLPGAPLFPMKRRDGTIETDRAPEPPNIDRWTGPVATLVDVDTASAAEMIAGALSVYRRGPSIGVPTYGKGCAQEYVDDDAHMGVLRLTTLLYALPDGSPVQRVGLAPTVLLGWETTPPATPPIVTSPPNAPITAPEREATLAHAPPTWRGPDVRDRALVATNEAFAWPTHGGAVGPCKDTDICRALRTLGAATKRTPTARGH